jgi:hypothetical protein
MFNVPILSLNLAAATFSNPGKLKLHHINKSHINNYHLTVIKKYTK